MRIFMRSMLFSRLEIPGDAGFLRETERPDYA